LFEAEPNWSIYNNNLIDFIEPHDRDFIAGIVKCVSCGNQSENPSNDHFFHIEEMILCESCYFDYNLMNNN